MLAITTLAATPRLAVRNGSLEFGGQRAFLNGVNQAWLNYGDDFGNNSTHGHFCALRDTLVNTSVHVGHSIRIWLHVEGDKTPQFDADGYVIATDASNTLISDMRRYLRAAAELDVLVFFVLWNGAVLKNEQTKALFASPPRLDSYITNVLTPMAAALAGEPGLGAWEIMNEPEGSVAAGVADSDPCFDTMALKNTGAGWAQSTPIPMKQVLTFVGRQAAAIHAADADALVTVGAWSEHSVSDALGLKDYYTPECLKKAAGGAAGAYLDFKQVHSYATAPGKTFNPTSPFRHSAKEFAEATPLLIGEFEPGASAQGENATTLYGWAHAKSYCGGWGWTALSEPTLYGGMASLKGDADVDVVRLPHAGLPDTCNCSDVAPTPDYTCQQQASWGKCAEPFMAGYCCRSCHECSASCAGGPPAPPYVPDLDHAEYRAAVHAHMRAALQ